MISPKQRQHYTLLLYLSDASSPTSCPNSGRPSMSLGISTKVLFSKCFGQEQVQDKGDQNPKEQYREMQRVNAQRPLRSITHGFPEEGCKKFEG